MTQKHLTKRFKFVKMKWSTWLRLRHTFKGYPYESAAGYIDRLSRFVEGSEVAIRE